MEIEKNEPNVDEKNKSEIVRPKFHWKFWKQRRFLLVFLFFFGFFHIYFLRVNLSIAIVAMTEIKTIVLDNGTEVHQKEFDWNSKQQGFILSSFFYGYITTQLLGGVLASRFGGRLIFGIGVLATAVLTLVTPVVAKTDFYLLIAVRIIEGVFEGISQPCIHELWSKWAPPLERTRLVAITCSGCNLGTVIPMPLCAYLAKAFGWESIFYISGVCGLIWCACWFYFVVETPSEDSSISDEELLYITESLGDQAVMKKDLKHPWKKIFTCPAFWAVVSAYVCENWGFYTMLTQLPMFMRDILHFDLGKTGFMSGLPYLVMSIVLYIGGYLADKLQERKILTTTQVRKLYTCGAFLSQMVFLLAAAYLMEPLGTTICLILAVGSGGFAWSGFVVNFLDIAPNHAGVMMGFANTLGTLPGILSPIIAGYIVVTPSGSEWQIVFYIAGGVYLIGSIIYGIFASGKRQTWASGTSIKETEERNVETELSNDNSKRAQT